MKIIVYTKFCISDPSRLNPRETWEHYKCMNPRFPTADIGIFVKTKNGELELRGMEQEEPYVDINNLPKVYWSDATGDSGGPVMRRITDSKGKERLVIVAVIAVGWENSIKPQSTKCISEVSKLTDEVVKWIKEIDKRNYETGK